MPSTSRRLGQLLSPRETLPPLLLLQTENVENAQLNLDLANDRFKSGLINSFDYRQVQAQYLNAQLERLRALRNLNASQAELVRLTGGLVREG